MPHPQCGLVTESAYLDVRFTLAALASSVHPVLAKTNLMLIRPATRFTVRIPRIMALTGPEASESLQ